MKKAGREQMDEADVRPEALASRPGVPRKKLGPAQCRAYMRRTLAAEFEGIVSGFVEQAKKGSCPHVKLVTELLEPRKRAMRPKTGRAAIARWVEEVERGR